MADSVTEILLRARMEVSGVEAGVNQIQKSLKGLTLPKGISDDLEKSFSKLTPLLKDYQKQLNKGFSNKKDLQKLILEINSMNESRKSLTKEAVSEAKKQDFSNDMFCLFDATDYPVGIAGVIANRLMDEFGKPAIVYTRNKGTVWPASSRSPGINLLPLYEKEKKDGNIKDYGGHAAACGLSLLSDVDTFKDSLNGQLREVLKDYKPVEKTLDIDAVIDFSQFTKRNLKEVEYIPTDRDSFPSPVFMLENLRVAGTRRSGNNPENICFTLVDDSGETKDIWAWGKGSEYESLGEPEYIDIAGRLTWGFGQYSDTVTFGVEEIRCSS